MLRADPADDGVSDGAGKTAVIHQPAKDGAQQKQREKRDNELAQRRHVLLSIGGEQRRTGRKHRRQQRGHGPQHNHADPAIGERDEQAE